MTEWLPKDKTCIVGIGETKYTPWNEPAATEFHLACEAILKAVADAGLTIKDIDGLASFSNDRNDAIWLSTALGIPQLRFVNMFWGGGGGGSAGAVMNACLAVATGTANYVVAFRSLAQGQFGRFGGGARPTGTRVSGEMAFALPFGHFTHSHDFALQARRHMWEYGTTSQQFGAISVACYKHAQRNPRAVMYGHPITIEDHQNSRMISDPLRLYDCCLETNGASAIVITSAERARDLKQKSVYITAAAQGSGFRQGQFAGNKPNFSTANFVETANDLWQRAGITPKDIDVAQIYENFTPMTLIALEDHGFCKRGEGGAFVEGGRLEWPDGELPINTSGGNIAEAYIHGLELVNEGVRQIRGTSTCQVKDAEFCLITGGPGISPVSDMIIRR